MVGNEAHFVESGVYRLLAAVAKRLMNVRATEIPVIMKKFRESLSLSHTNPEKMKKYILFVVFAAFNFVSFAQLNLVKNSSFEQNTACPTMWDQIRYADYWNAIDSSNLSAGCIPDYINGCSSSYWATEPVNSKFIHHPRHGDGMVLMAMYFDRQIPYSYNRDYLQGKLSSTLTAGMEYCVTFYTVMGDASSYAVNNIGAYLDDGTIDTTSNCSGPLTYITPQIAETSIVNDTINWTMIQGRFMANGTEKFITIGNYRDTAAVSKIWLNGNHFSWYLIDDVSVIPSNTHAYAGPDQGLAAIGDSVYLGVTSEGDGMPCYWYKLGAGPSPIDSGGTIKVKDTGTYVVEMDLCGYVTTDTVNVVLGTLKAVNTNAIQSVRLFPNPANGTCTLSFATGVDGVVSYSIKDVTGKCVYSSTMQYLSNKIQTEQITKKEVPVPGLYFITVTIDGESTTQKLVFY